MSRLSSARAGIPAAPQIGNFTPRKLKPSRFRLIPITGSEDKGHGYEYEEAALVHLKPCGEIGNFFAELKPDTQKKALLFVKKAAGRLSKPQIDRAIYHFKSEAKYRNYV